MSKTIFEENAAIIVEIAKNKGIENVENTIKQTLWNEATSRHGLGYL